MSVQDDRRERQLRELFGLEHVLAENRFGIDAHLTLGNAKILFELKSTTDRRHSVTTVRDFGPEHIAKWEGKHWLIGFYNTDGTELQYSLYGSPSDMAPWINEKRDYVAPDILLASRLPASVTLEDLWSICGHKDWYSLDDAKRIQKRQYSAQQYAERFDFAIHEESKIIDGYTPARMLEILRDRAAYLILRGSTLNNPHIPGSYFEGWPKITEHHADILRERVLTYLAVGTEGA